METPPPSDHSKHIVSGQNMKMGRSSKTTALMADLRPVCVWYQTQWALKQMKMMWSACKLEISAGRRRPEPTSVHLQDQISSSQVRDLPRDGNFCCDGGKMSQSIFSCYLGETATTVSSNWESGFNGSTAPPPGWCGCSAPVEIRQRGGKINTPEWISYINCTEILPSVTYRVSI